MNSTKQISMCWAWGNIPFSSGLSNNIHTKLTGENKNFNLCTRGIHISMKIPDNNAMLGIYHILDKGEKRGQGIKFQK